MKSDKKRRKHLYCLALEISMLESKLADRQQKIWTHFTVANKCWLLSKIRPKQSIYTLNAGITKRRHNFIVRPNPIKLNASGRQTATGSSDFSSGFRSRQQHPAAAAHSILARVSARPLLLKTDNICRQQP